MIAASGCGPNVESDPEVGNDHESLCAGGLPYPVQLDLTGDTLTFRSGGAYENGIVFSSAPDTCNKDETVGQIYDHDIAFLHINFWPSQLQHEAIHAGGMPPGATAYIAIVPKGQSELYPTEYSVGGSIQVDAADTPLSAKKPGYVRGRFEVEFAGAPPISSSFDIKFCKPVCYE